MKANPPQEGHSNVLEMKPVSGPSFDASAYRAHYSKATSNGDSNVTLVQPAPTYPPPEPPLVMSAAAAAPAPAPAPSSTTSAAVAPVSNQASVASPSSIAATLAPSDIASPPDYYAPGDIMYLLELVEDLDECSPNERPLWFRWGIAIIYCLLQAFITLTSTSYISAIGLVMDKFSVDRQRATLGQSLTIIGYAIGPILFSPISDIKGRKWVYVFTTIAYAILNIACSYSLNFPMLCIFMLLSGISGSVALTNVAGTIADCFGDGIEAAQAMALYVVSANLGPSLGAPLGAWVTLNPKLGLKWLFLINTIIGAVFAVVLSLIPETLPRLHMAQKAKKKLFVPGQLSRTGRQITAADIELLDTKANWGAEIKWILTNVYYLFQEPILLVLSILNGFTYGILFLYLDGVYDIFVVKNHLKVSIAELTYLNFVVGSLLMFGYTNFQTWLFKRDRKHNNHRSRQEAHLLSSRFTVWLFPISLFWFAFTCEGNTSYWSPIIAGTVLAFADPVLWLAMLLYIIDSYPHVAASAVTVFFVPSFLIGAGLSHLGIVMFEQLGAKWAMATLGFVSLFLCGAVEVLYKKGKDLRKASHAIREVFDLNFDEHDPGADNAANGGVLVGSEDDGANQLVNGGLYTGV